MVTFHCQLPVEIQEKIKALSTAAIALLEEHPGIVTHIPPRTDRDDNMLSGDVDIGGVRALIAGESDGWSPEFVKYSHVQWESIETSPFLKLQSIVHNSIPEFNAFTNLTGLLYCSGGCQSWHTKWQESLVSGVRTLRMYFCKNEDALSEFRIYNKLNDTVEIFHEPEGWSVVVCDLTEPLWHCVVSGKSRMVIGMSFSATC